MVHTHEIRGVQFPLPQPTQTFQPKDFGSWVDLFLLLQQVFICPVQNIYCFEENMYLYKTLTQAIAYNVVKDYDKSYRSIGC